MKREPGTSYRLGIDIGGTFTDAVLTNSAGERCVFKVSSTPADPGQGFIHAADAARAKVGFDFSEIEHLIHATTVATNAIIEGNTARIGLVVTAGFRDLLEIARQIRPSLFDLRQQKPQPLVPRNLVAEVTERLGPRGEVITPLDETSIHDSAARMRSADVQGVVVCLLHSYAEPAHERHVGQILQELLPGVDVSLSSDVWPEFREYFRASTCLVNLAIRPVMRAYIETIQSMLADRSFNRDFYIMQSSGGGMTAEAAKELPIQLIESGPAAGLLAAADLGRRMGWPNVVSLDIGGTTAKVGVILNGQPTLSREYEVGAMASPAGGRNKASGYPIRTPVLDLVEIGAGGGSIAWIDSGGALRVGPASAGAQPGPACYQRGGTQPTITDANLVLGRIDPAGFLDGSMHLDLEAARHAIKTHVAKPLGMTVSEAAAGIIAIANANMERALRLVTVQRGHDPREFVLVAYGGAGPLHANELATSMGFARVVVPPDPGVLSAWGLLHADLQHIEASTHVVSETDLTTAELVERFEALAARVCKELDRQGVAGDDIALAYSLDMRFRGQSYELSVALPDLYNPDVIVRAIGNFGDDHERAYGHAARDQEIEIVNWKVVGSAKMKHPQPGPVETTEAPGAVEPLRTRTIEGVEGQGTIHTYERRAMPCGSTVAGPAVVAEMGATTFVLEGFTATTDEWGNLLIERCHEFDD